MTGTEVDFLRDKWLKENISAMNNLLDWLKTRGYEAAAKEIKSTRSYEKLTGLKAEGWDDIWKLPTKAESDKIVEAHNG